MTQDCFDFGSEELQIILRMSNLKKQLVVILEREWNKVLRAVPKEVREDVRTLASLFV